MAIQLNKQAFDNAAKIIKNKLEVEHQTDWQEARPTPNDEVRYLDTHSLEEYGLWFLGINTQADPKSKSKFVYPYGDFNVLHKSALLASKKEAEKNKDHEIVKAIDQLLAMIK